MNLWRRGCLVRLGVLVGVAFSALVVGGAAASAAPLHTLAASPGFVPNCGATGQGGGSNNGFLPDDGSGNPVSDSKLDIGWSTGGGLFGGEDVPRNGIGQLTDLTFQAQRILAHFSISQVNAALQFCYVSDGPLPSEAQSISSSFQSQIVGPLGLGLFCVALMLFYCAWHALSGRVSRGVGELAVSLVILILTMATWAQPSTLLLGDSGLMAQGREAATTVGGVIATGQPPPDPTNPHSDIYQPLLEGMEKAFIFTPQSLLDWGQNFNGPGQPAACVAAYNHIVATGPHGTDDGPRDQMLAAGCSDAKNFNYTPTASRLADAVVSFIGAFFVLILAAVMAFGLMLCQFAMLAAVISAPFVFAAAVMPWGRRWLAKWVAGVLAAFLGQVVAVTVLSVVMVSINAVAGQAGTDGQPLFSVFALMDVIIVVGILYWIKWRHASKRAARRIASQVAGAQVGGGGEGGGGSVAQRALRGVMPRNSASGVAVAAATGAGAATVAERSARYVRQRTRRAGSGGAPGRSRRRPGSGGPGTASRGGATGGPSAGSGGGGTRGGQSGGSGRGGTRGRPSGGSGGCPGSSARRAGRGRGATSTGTGTASASTTAAATASVAPHRQSGVDLSDHEKRRLDDEWAALSEEPDDDELERRYADFAGRPRRPRGYGRVRVGGMSVIGRVRAMDDLPGGAG